MEIEVEQIIWDLSYYNQTNMEYTTLAQFKKEINPYSYPPLVKLHKKAIYFIKQLLAHKVNLDQININDWNSNTNPSVYVGSRRYSRLAESDWKLALKYIRKHK